MDHRALFQSVAHRPHVHGLDGSYEGAVAFVLGFDAATEGGVLCGLREWLIVRTGGGNNLAWPALIARAIKDESPGEAAAGTRSARLFGLLDEFFEERAGPNGLLRIHGRYIEWLRKQDWFRPEMLD